MHGKGDKYRVVYFGKNPGSQYVIITERLNTEYSLTVSDVADYLCFTKSYIQRLIRQDVLDAKIQEAPVKYYLVNPKSVEKFKAAPKNKGGRPRPCN